MDEQRNVFGEYIEECGWDPVTGYYRDGKCHTDDNDMGSHTVCVKVTDKFLDYSIQKGNDLSTPVPEFGFPGLIAGDHWCLCAERWSEAYKDGVAPKVILKATNIKVLEIISLDILKKYAIDLL